MAEPGIHYIRDGLYDGASYGIIRDGIERVTISNDGFVTIHTNGLKVGGPFGCNGAEPQPGLGLGDYPAGSCSHGCGDPITYCSYSSAANLLNEIASVLSSFGIIIA